MSYVWVEKDCMVCYSTTVISVFCLCCVSFLIWCSVLRMSLVGRSRIRPLVGWEPHSLPLLHHPPHPSLHLVPEPCRDSRKKGTTLLSWDLEWPVFPAEPFIPREWAWCLESLHQVGMAYSYAKKNLKCTVEQLALSSRPGWEYSIVFLPWMTLSCPSYMPVGSDSEEGHVHRRSSEGGSGEHDVCVCERERERERIWKWWVLIWRVQYGIHVLVDR